MLRCCLVKRHSEKNMGDRGGILASMTGAGAIFSLKIGGYFAGIVLRSSPMSAPVLTSAFTQKTCFFRAHRWFGCRAEVPVYRPMQYVMNGHPLPMAPASAFPTAPGAWGRQVSTVSNAPMTVPTEPLVPARPFPTGPVTPVSLQSMMSSSG